MTKLLSPPLWERGAARAVAVGREGVGFLGMRQRLIDYWWVWLLLVVAGGVGNELFDRSVSGGSHPAADVAIGVVLALLVCYVAGLVARRRRA